LGELFSRIIGRRKRDKSGDRRKEKNGGGSRGKAERRRNRNLIKEDKKEKSDRD